MRASKAEIEEFVNKNQKWIHERLAEERAYDKQKLRIADGGTIFFRARELSIIFKEGRKERILINGDKLIIQNHKLNSDKAKTQIERYLTQRATEYIIPRAEALAKYLGVDKKITEIKLRKTKSKWGHCTSNGVIQYNWLIMLAPYSIIDYMITHEVCHLLHMDHSRRYWDLVESICPQYLQYIKWLKKHEHRLWFD
jgi:predicted metal-dependent hydrolase